MPVVLVFAVVLLVAVLVSELARRTILSTAVLFLVAGFLSGNGVFGFIRLAPRDPIVATLAELALFSVLFTSAVLAAPAVACQSVRLAEVLPVSTLVVGVACTSGSWPRSSLTTNRAARDGGAGRTGP